MGLILTILSAVLLTAANYYGDLFFLGWISLLPFLYYIFILKREKITYKQVFLSGWNLGFWILLFSGNFLYHSIKLYTSAPTLIIVLLLIGIFLLLALIYGLFLLIYFFLQRHLFGQEKFNAFLFSLCWTLLEFSRHYLFGFFPVANPAYSQAEFISFIQLAELGGVWIRVFILVFSNALLFQLLFQKKYKNIFIVSLIFIVIFAFSYTGKGTGLAGAERSEKIKVGIITTQIKQSKKWTLEQFSKNLELVLNAAPELNQTRLIIAPETNLTFDFYADKYYREDFLNQIKANFKTPVQIGSLASRSSKEGRYNSTFLISEAGEVIERYDKNLLLYFGETYPYLDLLNKYTPYNFSSLNNGLEKEIFKYKNLKWKTVICSEILYPEYVRVEAAEVDFIVNQTNEAWFNESRLLKNIMWQAAVIRAVENRITVIKTGNQAHSGIIYPSGNYQKVDQDKNYHILEFN